jgi:hypothetical protein
MVEIALSFAGVFVGAFLAIGLENWRERRVTRRWVRAHLAHLMGHIVGLERPTADEVEQRYRSLDQALDTWAAAEEQLDEETWELLGYTALSSPVDFAHLLRSEAVAVLPKGLAHAIADVEYWSGMLGMSSRSVNDIFVRDVLPLWFERKVPLSDADRRRLRWYQEELRRVIDVEVAAVEAVDRMIAEYREFATKAPARRG